MDDEPLALRALCDTLRDQNFDVAGFENSEAALEEIRNGHCDVVLTDLMMPGMDGVELLKEAQKIDQHLVGVLMTGHGTIETAVKAMQAGAIDYILKPVKLGALLPIVSRAVSVRRLKLENLELRNTVAFHELNQAIAHTLEEDALLEKIADAALEQFQADEASVMLIPDDESCLYVAAVRGGDGSTPLGHQVPMREGIVGWVAEHGEPRITEPSMSTAAPTDSTEGGAPDDLSSLCMPLTTRGELIGVLNVHCRGRKRPFSRGQIKALSIFTNAAAASIKAARLHDERRRADARYRHVLDMAADGIVSIDENQRIVIFNPSAERIFGYRTDEVVGRPVDILLPESALDRHADLLATFRAGADTRRTIGQSERPLFGRRKDGSLFNAEIGVSKRTESGETLYTAVIRDITERVQQDKKIARINRIRQVHNDLTAAIMRTRERIPLCRDACRIAVATGQFRMAWIGFSDAEGNRADPVCSAGADDGYIEDVGRSLGAKQIDTGAAGRAIREGRPVVINDIGNDSAVAFREEAVSRGFQSLAVLPLMQDGAANGVIAIYSNETNTFDPEEMILLEAVAADISLALDAIEKRERLFHATRRNPVTGLPNRLAFTERMEHFFGASSDDGHTITAVLLDVERFRNINESLGRQVGDVLLRELGERLADAAGMDTTLAHFGADQFIVAKRFSGAKPGAVARLVEQLLTSGFSRPFGTAQTSLRLAARAGVVVHPADGHDVETFLQNAEAALRDAKRSGLKYQFYAPSMNSQVAHILQMESRLRGALERNAFRLFYQPKVELRSGEVAGFEALIRWIDPELGFVPPIQFVPLLEETGMIVDVGNWALKEATRVAVDLAESSGRFLRVAVNVSPIQLQQSSFVDDIKKLVRANPTAASCLALEITESVIMQNLDENVAKLDQIRGMGIEIAIDDFGTGHSSLAYIGRLPVSVIKIDRAFIQGLGITAESKRIVETIISLTHNLDRIAVAEGVETKQQADLLHRLDCDQYQGFLFSKPLPENELIRLLGGCGTGTGSNPEQRSHRKA